MLRILTYNTQLRSAMMEVGFPPSIPPVYTAPTRAACIANNILASTAEYDVVCLNEVFDEDARAVLSKRLEGQYPYQVTKADLLYTELVRPGLVHDISNAVFDMAFQPLLDVASVLALKLEDSGLFLASRWPFDVSAVPQSIIDKVGAQQAADLFPDGLVAVSFMTYADCDGGFMADCRSAKGVLWARIQRDPQHSFDIFASHTQADDNAIEEHAEARDKQLLAAWRFIVERTGGPPFIHPTFFLGDFNIPSHLADPPTNPPSEWQRVFNTPGQPLTDHLADQWGTVQCRGGGSGLTDPGFTADVTYEPLRQRLDIIAADPGDDLVAQHMAVDYAVSTVPAGVTDVMYLSDHLPLGIDLSPPHNFASPPTALKITAVDYHSGPRELGPGQVVWYRYVKQGTYEFRLDAEDPAVYYEVFLGDDLSRPRRIYRNERDPELGDRFVLVAPFFVKVGNRRREREFAYEFNSHRHTGIDPHDALHLIPGISYPETFPNQQLNGDDTFVSPWDDMDTKWFLLETPRLPVSDMAVSVDLTVIMGAGPLQLLVALREMDGKATFVDQAGATSTTSRVEWRARPDESYFVCIQRQDPSFKPTDFNLVADVDISLLRGGQAGLPRLVCTKETSGWGADDISLRLKSDAGWARDISNDEIGDFEQDAVRDLAQWIPDVVAYASGLTVSVVEEDDIGHDDIGSVTIPKFSDLHSWPNWTSIHTDLTGRAEGAVTIPVDDGTYTLRCSIGNWDETV